MCVGVFIWLMHKDEWKQTHINDIDDDEEEQMILHTSSDTGLVLRPSKPSANMTKSCSTRLLLVSAKFRRARNNSSGCCDTRSGSQYGQWPDSMYDSVMPLGPFPVIDKCKHRTIVIISRL